MIRTITRQLHTMLKLQNTELLKTKAFINNEWISTSSTYDVTDPATEQVIAQVTELDSHHVDQAIDAAYDAFQTFKKTTPRQRAAWLRNLHGLMLDNLEDLAVLITRENGKALADARGEVRYAASYFEWFAEEAPRMYGTTIQPSNGANRVYTLKQPVGVVGILTPWNFPSAMITRKAAAAFAAGCTCVVKADHFTPLSALALAHLVEKAGFPKGVFNVLTTSNKTPEFGLKLCESPKVKKISFTGSTNVGKILMKQSASTLKKLSMELGGNAPVIVFDDCDLDNAVKEVVAGKFRSLGQTCVCINRIYVHEKIYTDFVAKFVDAVKQFKIGHGMDDGVTHGCLVHEGAIAKVEDHVKDAISKGAKVEIEGGRLPNLGPTFYSPTVLSNVPSNAKVCKEETFGPLAAIIPFSSTAEVIEWANDSDVGLASYVFSENYKTVMAVAEALESGMVSCNTGVFSDCAIAFGGIKESGFGREGSGIGIDDYVFVKSVTIGGIPSY